MTNSFGISQHKLKHNNKKKGVTSVNKGGYEERVCKACGKPKGTMAIRYRIKLIAHRDYFHPNCIKDYIKDKEGE